MWRWSIASVLILTSGLRPAPPDAAAQAAQTQTRTASDLTASSNARVDSAWTRRARREIRAFARYWRSAWKLTYREISYHPDRYAAAHCHFDGVGQYRPLNRIASGTRKSMCPLLLPP